MNVKPGDLAMVIQPDPWAGATCTVLAGKPNIPAAAQIFGPWHLVRFPRPMPWDYLGHSGACVGAMQDSVLRRITGPDVPVTEETRDEVPA